MGYGFLAVSIILLILYYILGRYAKLLTPNQNKELVIGTILMIILLDVVRSSILDLDYNFIAGFMFVNWYFITKAITNSLTVTNDIMGDYVLKGFSLGILLLFMLYLRLIFLGDDVNSMDIIVTTGLFILWYMKVKWIGNLFNEETEWKNSIM